MGRHGLVSKISYVVVKRRVVMRLNPRSVDLKPDGVGKEATVTWHPPNWNASFVTAKADSIKLHVLIVFFFLCYVASRSGNFKCVLISETRSYSCCLKRLKRHRLKHVLFSEHTIKQPCRVDMITGKTQEIPGQTCSTKLARSVFRASGCSSAAKCPP